MLRIDRRHIRFLQRLERPPGDSLGIGPKRTPIRGGGQVDPGRDQFDFNVAEFLALPRHGGLLLMPHQLHQEAGLGIAGDDGRAGRAPFEQLGPGRQIESAASFLGVVALQALALREASRRRRCPRRRGVSAERWWRGKRAAAVATTTAPTKSTPRRNERHAPLTLTHIAAQGKTLQPGDDLAEARAASLDLQTGGLRGTASAASWPRRRPGRCGRGPE